MLGLRALALGPLLAVIQRFPQLLRGFVESGSPDSVAMGTSGRAGSRDPGTVRSPAGSRSFISATYDPGAGTVTPSQGRSSHWLTTLACANALIIVPEAVINLAAGETADLLELPA